MKLEWRLQNEVSGAYVKQALSVDAFKATD